MSNNGNEPWIVPQEADLNDYLVSPQVTALATAALAPGQADPWTNIMKDVVNEIRSAIRGGCIKNVTPILVSQTPLSIPPDLKRTALVLIAERYQMRIPSLALTEDQKDAAKIARRLIERIQMGLATVTAPPDPMTPDDQQRGGSTTVVRANRRRFTRRSMEGL